MNQAARHTDLQRLTYEKLRLPQRQMCYRCVHSYHSNQKQNLWRFSDETALEDQMLTNEEEETRTRIDILMKRTLILKGCKKWNKKNGALTLALSTAHTCYNPSPLTGSLHMEGNEIVLSKPLNWIRLTRLARCPLLSNLSRQGARVHWNQWWFWCGLGAGRQISPVSQMIFHSIFSFIYTAGGEPEGVAGIGQGYFIMVQFSGVATIITGEQRSSLL